MLGLLRDKNFPDKAVLFLGTLGGIVEQPIDGARDQADSATANSQMTYVNPQLLEDEEEEDMVGLEGFENTLVRLFRILKLIPDSPRAQFQCI